VREDREEHGSAKGGNHGKMKNENSQHTIEVLQLPLEVSSFGGGLDKSIYLGRTEFSWSPLGKLDKQQGTEVRKYG
jgi:hypothetical protein